MLGATARRMRNFTAYGLDADGVYGYLKEVPPYEEDTRLLHCIRVESKSFDEHMATLLDRHVDIPGMTGRIRPEDLKRFHESNAERMPMLQREGRTPMSVRDLLLQRLATVDAPSAKDWWLPRWSHDG